MLLDFALHSNLLILCTCLVLTNTAADLSNDEIQQDFVLKQNQAPIRTVSDKFLSFTLDSSELRNMTNLPINKQKFINLVRHLSPAYFRIGGISADCLIFVNVMNFFLKNIL